MCNGLLYLIAYTAFYNMCIFIPSVLFSSAASEWQKNGSILSEVLTLNRNGLDTAGIRGAFYPMSLGQPKDLIYNTAWGEVGMI